MTMATLKNVSVKSVRIPVGDMAIEGDLALPEHPIGVVLFAHGSGSSRFSRRNQFVAEQLVKASMATLLIDLLTQAEERLDADSGHLRFDITLLADRLVGAIGWLA